MNKNWTMHWVVFRLLFFIIQFVLVRKLGMVKARKWVMSHEISCCMVLLSMEEITRSLLKHENFVHWPCRHKLHLLVILSHPQLFEFIRKAEPVIVNLSDGESVSISSADELPCFWGGDKQKVKENKCEERRLRLRKLLGEDMGPLESQKESLFGSSLANPFHCIMFGKVSRIIKFH